MEKILRGLPYFAEVAKQKSFSRAAELLDVPLPSLSRRIAALEKELGVSLLHRTTRTVELTENGKLFLEGCDYILSELDVVLEVLRQNEKSTTGQVRVSVPVDLYFRFLLGVFGDFARQHPGIELRVVSMPRWVDLRSEPFDLEIRVGPLPDSDLKIRRLVTMSPGLFATQEFLDSHFIPEKPQDLGQLPFIWLYQIDHCRLDLIKGKKKETVTVRPVHRVSSVALAFELLLAGQGVSMMERGIAQEHVEKGLLVRVLPGWHTTGVDISVVMAPGRVPNRIRLFIDFLVAHFAKLE